MIKIELIEYEDKDYEYVYDVKKIYIKSMSKNIGKVGMKIFNKNISKNL